jgi:hypothetical protein
MVSEVDEKKKNRQVRCAISETNCFSFGASKASLRVAPLVLLGSGMIKLTKRQKNENLPICDLNRKAPYNLHKKTTDQRSLSVGKDFFWVQKYIFSVKFPNILPEMMFIRK